MDAEFREERDRTVFAREVAIRIVRYRADRGMAQTQLAQAVGMKQPVIARLERREQPLPICAGRGLIAGIGGRAL
jgi:ribosome-binding protein aMBF1 (putative translation factor)